MMHPFTGTPEDLETYETQVYPGMSPDDVHPTRELLEKIQKGELWVWWYIQNGEKVGWCALHPWHGKYAPQAWHLWGVWVREDWRRKGIAEAMWHYRMKLVPPGIPITVSVQNGKEGSEHLIKKLGFEYVCWKEPWNEYVFWNK